MHHNENNIIINGDGDVLLILKYYLGPAQK